ncbi:MAG: SDR family oxidoreductase [Clostridia bacterium]
MGKTVLITGAAKGIGRQIALDFLQDGYNVCINYNTSSKQAYELKEMSLTTHQNLIVYRADVSNREEVDSMVDFVLECFGSIDVLVNNAGISELKLFTDIEISDMQKMINTSIMGTFNTTQSVLKKFMIGKKEGSIINISSIWGLVGASCEVHYATVKSAIDGMTKSLAKELGLCNIRVNSVAPGVIKTDMLSSFSEQELTDLIEQIPLNRLGEVEDVSKLVKFLGSKDASYITGQVISPNGGIVI